MAIKIITDSTSYIPREYIEKYDIRIISLNVIMNGVSEREVDIDNEEFYKEIDKSTEIPTSSQPSTKEYYEVFEKAIKEGNDILAIFLASKMSGTYSAGFLIKDMLLEKYPKTKIEILDSMNTTMAMGFSVVEVAKMARSGENSLNKLKSKAESILQRSHILFAPGGLKYLKKGGRIGAASALLGSVLQIIPILHVKNGEVEVLEKVRTKKKAINKIIEILEKQIREEGLGDIVLYHILNKEEVIELKRRIKSKLKLDAKIMDIGPIIGLHVGPGSIGVAYYNTK